jgi:hypothetical protein
MATTTDPNSSYYAAIQADMASNNPATSLVGATAAASAPSIAQQQLSVAGTEQQLADTGPGLQQQGDYAALMAGYQKGGLGINEQQTALQQQGTEQNYALQQQGFQEQAQKNQLQFTQALQSAVGGSAASGALNTQGSKQQQTTIGQEAQWAGQDLSRQEQLSAGDFARAQQNYGLIAQANGLSVDEVNTRLQYGLQQLGENADPTALVSQAGNALSGETQGVGSVLSQAGLEGGMNALAALG